MQKTGENLCSIFSALVKAPQSVNSAKNLNMLLVAFVLTAVRIELQHLITFDPNHLAAVASDQTYFHAADHATTTKLVKIG